MIDVKFSCKPQVTNSQVIERLNELESLIYNPLSFYKVKMTDGFSYSVPFYVHNLPVIRGVTVLNPSDEEVETKVKIFANKNVEIDSNINLIDSTLIIF